MVMSSDLAQFARRIEVSGHALFSSGQGVTIARAPGRLDVMGGIADYSGSLVLELPLRHATLAAVQLAEHGGVQVVSVDQASGATRSAGLTTDEWSVLCAQDYSTARQHLVQSGKDTWMAYVAGPLLVLVRECDCDIRGARIVIESSVPEAKGVSSSAAIEVATMRAVAAAMECSLSASQLASLCQLAENAIAGAPCGIMDQMTSAVGQRDHLLALRCQPAEVEGQVAVPESIRCWGMDSGIRHAVTGFDYGAVRAGAFMGYRIIAELAGLEVDRSLRDRDAAQHGTKPLQSEVVVEINDPQWKGYLANIRPDEFERRFAPHLPESMKGSEFLDNYTGISDTVTRVDSAKSYPVLAATRHPIEECARVERFRELLATRNDETACKEMGALMYAAHESYSACGLGSDGTDVLVELCRSEGAAKGIYGARITGGGSGGTVAILARSDAEATVTNIARRYEAQTGREAAVFSGSSSGAVHIAPVHVIAGGELKYGDA